MHQTVVDVFHISRIRDIEGLLHDHTTCINVLVEEESGDTRLLLAIDDCPVDGGSTTILWQQGRMNVEGAVFGHIPDHLGQHPEGDHHLEIGLIATQLLDERRILHLLGLQHRELVLQCIFLHFRGLCLRLMTSHGLVRLCHNSHHVVLVLYQRLQRLYRKLRRSHKHNP